MSEYNLPTGNDSGIEDEYSQRVRLEELEDERKIAFLQWLEASKTWSSLRRSVEECGGESLSEAQNLRGLEQRLNIAAEAFVRLQDRIRDIRFTT